MAERFAVVCSADAGMLVGVNALLNSLKYYGNEVDFHLLYWPSEQMDRFITSVRDNGFYPGFFPVDLVAYYKGTGGEGFKQTAVFYLATYRYPYCSSLKDYDAVMMIDADAVVVNNLAWFFRIVANTDYIILPNNNVTGEEYDTCELVVYQSAAAPALHCFPLIFKPSLYGDVFSQMPQLCDDMPMDDMTGCNYVLVKNGLMRTKVFVVPNLFWVNTAWDYVPMSEQWFGDKRFIIVNSTDRLNVLHGRWWFAFNMPKFAVEPKKPSDWRRNHSLRLLWETYYFFNNRCFHNIEWDSENWGEPSMFDELNKEMPRWQNIRPRWL